MQTHIRPKLEYGLPFYDKRGLMLLESAASEAIGILLGPTYVAGSNWEKAMWLLNMPEWTTRQRHARHCHVYRQVISPYMDNPDNIAFLASQLEWFAELCAACEEQEPPDSSYQRLRLQDQQALLTLRIRTHDDPDTDPRLPKLVYGKPHCLLSHWSNKDQRNAWQHLFYRFPPDPSGFRFYTLGKYGDAHLLDRWTRTLLHSEDEKEARAVLHKIQSIVAEISPIYHEFHIHS